MTQRGQGLRCGRREKAHVLRKKWCMCVGRARINLCIMFHVSLARRGVVR